MVVGWAVFPKVLYSKKSQPIDFSHAMHLEEVDNGCESCHFFVKTVLIPVFPNWSNVSTAMKR
jgi:hypothetical protein